MTRPHVPQEVLDAAHERKVARLARDFEAADRLKAQIEAAGWRVVDRGVDFALSPLHPVDVVEGGQTRYGWSGSVPSRLAEPVAAPATVIIRATDDAGALERTAAGVTAHSPARTQLVIVADGASAEVTGAAERLAASHPAVEVVWTASRLGTAGALNVGLRRAVGAVVVVLGAGVTPSGDVVSPLVVALADPGVAVAGACGQAGADIQSLAPAEGSGSVTAVDDTCIAFRRADAADRGPLDEQFRSPRLLAAWWSLVLRDEAEGASRRAAAVAALPLSRGGEREALDVATGVDAGERERLVRRDRYRLLNAFRDRDDLLVGASPA